MIDSLKTNFLVSIPEIVHRTMDTLENFPWENPTLYSQWLAQTFFIVQHTPRYICLAAARFDYSQNDFHRTLVAHLSDEDLHEEDVLNDLKNLGHVISEFSPMPEVKIMTENLYYQIDNINPLCIFGRILFLEYVASNISENLRKRISSTWDLNQRQFLKIHFEEDVEHVKKAFSVVHGLTDEQQRLVGDQFYLSGLFYTDLMSAIELSNNGVSHQDKRSA